MNKTQHLIYLTLICAGLVIATGFVIYHLQKKALRQEIATTYEVSAKEISSQLSLPMKVNNLHEMKRIVSGSFIASHSDFVTLSDSRNTTLMWFPELEHSNSLRSCRFDSFEVPVLFASEKVGSITYCYDLNANSRLVVPVELYFLAFAIISALTILLWIWHRRSVFIVESFLKELDQIDFEKASLGFRFQTKLLRNCALDPLRQKIDILLKSFDEASRQKQWLESQKVLIEVSQQVAHDIRSPLVALQILLSDFESSPAEKQLLLKSAVERIQRIASDLDKRDSKTFSLRDETLKSEEKLHLLYPVLEATIDEKKLLAPQVSFELQVDSSALSSFARFDVSNFQRMISNIIQNSIEAIKGTDGRVQVKVFTEESATLIRIQDNGRGIPQKIMGRVFERGFSFGKKSGSGLGLSHARLALEEMGGSLSLHSNLGKGTTVEIQLPKMAPPAWFAGKLSYDRRFGFALLDDDPSIQELWRHRLKGNAPFYSFTKSADLIAWLHSEECHENTQILVDYDLGDGEPNGLEVIKNHLLDRRVTLVTSRYIDSALTECCDELQLLMIPKFLAPYLPIEMEAEL